MANSVHTQTNKSQFHETVCLYEWWLTWAYNHNHEKRLAIAGYTPRDQQALRVFSSAPILKRHDVSTLETTDGIYVMILGYINKTRTAENGFPPEMISSYFLFGFPPHWEACSEFFLAQGSDSNGVLRENASLKCSIKANKEKHERINGEANVNSANAGAKLDKKYAVRYITRSCGSKKTDHKKSAVVEKENVLTEKAATKEVSASEMKTKRKLKYGSPVALQVEEVTSIVSPELSSIKKSRSGRLLLPTLEFWHNQTAVYGADHQIIGIKDIISTPSKVEVTPEPKKAEGKSK